MRAVTRAQKVHPDHASGCAIRAVVVGIGISCRTPIPFPNIHFPALNPLPLLRPPTACQAVELAAFFLSVVGLRTLWQPCAHPVSPDTYVDPQVHTFTLVPNGCTRSHSFALDTHIHPPSASGTLF
eukprot:326226-Chlamydomonas_euryale.AAC.4